MVVCGKTLRLLPLKGKFCCPCITKALVAFMGFPFRFIVGLKGTKLNKQRCAHCCQELLVVAVSSVLIELGSGTEAEVGR